MKILGRILFSIILIISMRSFALASGDWKAFKTDHFTVFYKPGFEEQAKDVLKTMEHYRPEVEKLTGNEVFHLPVVIEDGGTQVNGSADPFTLAIHLFNYPGEGIRNMMAVENWWQDVGIHEYTHILQLTKNSGICDAFNWYPNVAVPGWIIEGITVYNESQISPYQGRLNDGAYDAVVAALAKDKGLPDIIDASARLSQFPTDGIYVFGGSFTNYLSKTYGEEKLTAFYAENGSSVFKFLSPVFPAAGFDQSAKKIFGKSFTELWDEWRRTTTEKAKGFYIDGERVSNSGWYTENPVVDAGKVYYQKIYFRKTAADKLFAFKEIVERDSMTRTEKTLVSTTASFSAPLKIRNGKLYYAVSENKSGYANATENTYGLYTVLHQKDLRDGNDTILIEDAIRAFEVLLDGNILYTIDRKDAFGSDVYLYSPEKNETKQLFKSDYIVDEIVSDAKRVVVTARKDWEHYSLYALSLDKQAFLPIVDTPYVEGAISLQGEKLFFSADYDKVYRAYCYDFSSAKLFCLTQGGFAVSPAYDQQSKALYFIGVNSDGYDLYKSQPEFKEFSLPQAQRTQKPVYNLAESEIKSGNYIDDLKTLMPYRTLPIFKSSDDETEFGVNLKGGDAIGDFPLYSASIIYNTKKKGFNYELDLDSQFFAPLSTRLILEKDDKKSAGILLQYPLLKKLSPGISNLTAGVKFKCEESEKPEIEPMLGMGFNYPQTKLDIEVRTPYQRNIDASSPERKGFYTDLSFRQYIHGSELGIKAQRIYDPQNSDTVFPEIRGYSDALNDKVGTVFSVDYSKTLFKIGKGLWNPNIYFGDVSATVFVDGAIPKDGKKQMSVGLELNTETKVIFGLLPFTTGIRFVRNNEKENKVGLFVKMPIDI